MDDREGHAVDGAAGGRLNELIVAALCFSVFSLPFPSFVADTERTNSRVLLGLFVVTPVGLFFSTT